MYLICSRLQNANLAFKLTTKIKEVDKLQTAAKLGGTEKHVLKSNTLFEEFHSIEGTKKLHKLVKRILSLDWSENIANFLRHPQVFSNAELQNVLVSKIETVKLHETSKKYVVNILNVVNFSVLDGTCLMFLLHNGLENKALLNTFYSELFNGNFQEKIALEYFAQIVFKDL